MTRERLPAAALACALLAGCAGPESRVDPAALSEQIDAGTAPLVLDVRSLGEYEAGHVPGAAHLPFQSTWTENAQVPADRGAPVVVYCEHGPRAGLARFGLRSLGYERVLVLDGHMAGWREAGLPVATGAASAD